MNKKILFLFVCACFLLFSSASGFANENLATNYYVESGKKLFEKKNYDLAIVEFNKALLANPDNEEALMYLRMLGFGSSDKKRTSSSREQGQSAQSVDHNKKVQKNTPKAATVKPVDSDKNLSVEAIETRIAQEEKAALESLRAESAQKENKELSKAKPVLPQEKSSIANKKEVKKSKVKKAKAPKTEVQKLQGSSEKVVLPKVVPEQAVAQEVPVEKVALPKVVPEQVVSQEVVQKTAVKKQVLAAEKSEVTEVNDDIDPCVAKCEEAKKESAENISGAVVKKPQGQSTLKQQETAAIKAIEKETAKEKARIHGDFAQDKAKKIQQVHAKYKGKPIGKNEKAVFKDINGDGIDERISSGESKAIEKVEIALDKEEKEALKNLEKRSAQKQKIALKKVRAKNTNIDKPGLQTFKAGDVVSDLSDGEIEALALDQDDVVPFAEVLAKQTPVKSVPEKTTVKKQQVNVPPSANATTDVTVDLVEDAREKQDAIDKPEVLAQNQFKSGEDQAKIQVEPVENNEDLAQKQAQVHKKFEAKKAAMILEAQKASLEKSIKPAEVQNVSLDGQQSQLESNKDEDIQIAVSQAIEKKVEPVVKENVGLKQKLGEVIEMAQQDQKIIQDLEQNVKQQNDKVEVLETDLVETKQALESKKEELKEQSVKLNELQTRIDAMQADVESKQYDFKDKQLEYEKKLQAIEEEFGNYKSQKAKNEEELQDQLKILKEALAKKIAELNEAQEKLIFVENKLAKTQAEHTATLKQYEDLKNTMGDLESRLTDFPAEIKTDKMPSVELDVKNLPAPKNSNEFMYQQWIQRQDKLITQLKEKLLWAREQMDYLGRYDIKLSDQKMAALKEQLAAVKKQLSTQDLSGSQKSQEYVLMEERLKDAQQRLEIVEKILREKDEQVQELEKQLNGVLSAF